MTEPFHDPPPLGEGFEARTRQRVRQLRNRRRAGAATVAALLILVVGIAFSANGPGSHPGAELHVTGSTLGGPAVNPDGSSTAGPAIVGSAGPTTFDPDGKVTRPQAGAGDASSNSGGAGGGSPARRSTRGAHSESLDDGTTGVPSPNGSPTVPAASTTVVSSVSTTTPSTTTDPFACPTGGNVDVDVVLHATPVSFDSWNVDGTVTITNGTGDVVGTIGWVYLGGATVPGTGHPVVFGWEDPDQPIVWPYQIGQLWVPPHSSRTFTLSQPPFPGVTWVGPGGANAVSPDYPVVTSGDIKGGWGHPRDSCPGLTWTQNFVTGAPAPNPADYQ